MKRIFDICISVIALIILLPLFLIIYCLVKIDSKGPAFYVQERVGHKEKNFNLIKFRSLIVDQENNANFFTSKDDPRITKTGKWLRKLSLDELPQLINVLLGTMSLVGPRPDLMVQKELYAPSDWALRTSVKPGITGLAQATLRSNATFEERKNYDLYYINNYSFLFDIKILFMTIKQVFSTGGF